MELTQLVVVTLTIAATLLTWFLNERSKRCFEDYVRREQRYAELVRSLRGFQVDSPEAVSRERFLTEVDLCWLYGTDEVVRSAYEFLETVKADPHHAGEHAHLAAGRLVWSIRDDLLRREPLSRTTLSPSEFQILKVNQAAR